jgi:hypothetical protein
MPYTVTAVSDQTRPWNSQKGGPMISYRVDLKDSQGVNHPNVEWARKATSQPPQIGETADGNLDNTEYGLKFKAAFTGAGGGGGGRPKDPAERAAIAASVALREGREAVEQAVTMGLVKPADLDAHAELWKRYANFAFNFIDRKSKAA